MKIKLLALGCGGRVISGAKKQNLNQYLLMLRWPVIIIIGIWILVVELLEHPDVLEGGDKTFLYEVIVLEGLLVVVGIAIGWLVKTVREKSSMVKILEAKNELSQQLWWNTHAQSCRWRLPLCLSTPQRRNNLS
jgi:hypothetical protein